MRFVIAFLVLGLALPFRAFGQGPPVGDCGAEQGGTIRGVVVDDRTGHPVPMSNIYHYSNCRTPADYLGRFVLRRVPPGEGRVEAFFPGYRLFTPVAVEVLTRDTAVVELRLVPGGPLEDCRALPPCAGFVGDGPVPILDDEAAFRLAALGTVVGLKWVEVTADGSWHACIDESDDVRVALAERYTRVADADDCEIGPGADGHRMRHVASGNKAFRVMIEGVTGVTPHRRTVSLMYLVGPDWAAEWDCDLEKTSHGWRPTLCIQTSVS